MQAAEALLRQPIEVTVVGGGAFPAHPADDANRFHIVFMETSEFSAD